MTSTTPTFSPGELIHAVDEGFGLARPPEGDWLVYEGLGTPAVIRLTLTEGEYVVPKGRQQNCRMIPYSRKKGTL